MGDTIEAKGTNGRITFDGQSVLLQRKGISARLTVGVGEKRIPVASITAVQWKNAGLSAGFIQFTLAGGVERRSAFGRQSHDARHDENSITFHSRQQKAFEVLRAAIEEAIAARHAHQPHAPAASMADELAKLAALRDQGVITAQDFEGAKARLLGL